MDQEHIDALRAEYDKADSRLVARFDLTTLESPRLTPEGFLRGDALITREGIFEYSTPHGVLREYRPGQEVFSEDSLDTLRMKPITDDHPSESGQRVMVDTKNHPKFSKGHLGENITRVDGKVRASLMITDEALAKAVMGGRNQISCGYMCDLEFAPGVTPGGQKFDATQRNIRYNHVAVVAQGRAGPQVSMRIDSMDGAITSQQVETPTPEEPSVVIYHV